MVDTNSGSNLIRSCGALRGDNDPGFTGKVDDAVVLNRANDWNDMCQWLVRNAGSWRCQIYWEVLRGYIVRFGSRRILGGYGESATPAAEPALPPDRLLLGRDDSQLG